MATEQWKQDNVEKMRAYRREWYLRNRDEEIKKARKNNKVRKKEYREWFDAFKKTLQCNRCPESDFRCLDFHHSDPSKKDITVSAAVSRGWSKDRILEEISKCEVICSNCHRKHHRSESV